MTERRYYDDKLQAWVTVCPPGQALGASDLTNWAHRRARGLSGSDGRKERKAARKWAGKGRPSKRQRAAFKLSRISGEPGEAPTDELARKAKAAAIEWQKHARASEKKPRRRRPSKRQRAAIRAARQLAGQDWPTAGDQWRALSPEQRALFSKRNGAP